MSEATPADPASESLNGDLTERVLVHSDEMDWTPSPGGQVLRKRLHLVGGAESGQVTSVVQYLPGAKFPEHPHPEGEEILVLSGTFSDHSGDAHAGTHLLNPEGFAHAPWSEPGCVILVKLRQYAGPNREHRFTETEAMPWVASAHAGVEEKTLYAEPGFPDVTRLERWAPGAAPGERRFEGGAELFVIEGGLEDGADALRPGSWLRIPPGGALDARTDVGCTVYLKTGALPSLRSG